jgi:hypothetical protein
VDYAQTMKRVCLFWVVIVLASCAAARAQEKGTWRATSSTARSITGDVSLSDAKISISFANFTIARIRSLEPSEIGAAFDADSNAGGSGSLYKLNVPAATRFLHKNTLCGAEETQWMVTYVAGRTLQVAFFSGQKPPQLTLEAVGSSSDLCGTFTYTR